ncbi:MAG: bacteriohemerythrin [Lachnospiraceae bacterium]
MFQFTEDCILGVEQIDEEHRHLFDLINEGIDMLHGEHIGDQYEDIKDLLAELEDYADEHFTHEEAYMERICDPELILQRTQHMFFREKIRECTFQNIDEEENQKQVLEDLMMFLAKWLYHHILGSDIMIGKLPPLEEWMIRENPCEFTEEYLTGIEMIDKEHQELFRIIEKANMLVKSWTTGDKYDDIMEILGELKEYTKYHFSDEEEYMAAIHYEGLEAQKRAHEAFVDKIENILVEEIDENPQEYLERLMEFLLGWLINHILHTDKKIPLA